ncbi:MAG: hypothetical protein AAFY29_15830 [Pseudomonadota bacterium]
MNLETLAPALGVLLILLGLASSLWLLRAPSIYLLSIHVISRVILDSQSAVTYEKVAAGLSVMQLYSVAFIGAAALHLLIQRKFTLHRYTMPLLAIVATALLSATIAESWTAMIALALRWSYLWVMIGLTVSTLEQGHGERLIWAVAAAGVYAFGNQMYTVITDQPKWGAGIWSYVGTFNHESDISFLLIMLLIPGVYLISRADSALKSLVGAGFIVAVHLGLGYAAYRSLWVATAGYWGFYLWTRYLRGSASRRATWMIASLGGGMFAVALFGSTVVDKMSDLVFFVANPSQYLDFSGNAKSVDLMSGRVDLINGYMALFLNSGSHVWVAGIGPSQGAKYVGLYAHNEYLSALVETGILGLVALLWFLWRFVVDAFSLTRSGDALAQATAPYVMAILLASLGTMPFQDMRAMLTLGLVLGALVYFCKLQRQPVSEFVPGSGTENFAAVARERRSGRDSGDDSELSGPTGPQILGLRPVEILR